MQRSKEGSATPTRAVYTIKNGTIVAGRGYCDVATMMSQLELTPEVPAAATSQPAAARWPPGRRVEFLERERRRRPVFADGAEADFAAVS